MRVDRRSVAALALPGGPAPPTSAETRNPDRDAYSAETHIDSRYNWAGVATDSEYVGVAQLANEPGLAASKLPAAQPLILKARTRAELMRGPVRRQSNSLSHCAAGLQRGGSSRSPPRWAHRSHEPTQTRRNTWLAPHPERERNPDTARGW